MFLTHLRGYVYRVHGYLNELYKIYMHIFKYINNYKIYLLQN